MIYGGDFTFPAEQEKVRLNTAPVIINSVTNPGMRTRISEACLVGLPYPMVIIHKSTWCQNFNPRTFDQSANT